MSLARVTLKKAKTYALGSRRWVQDVPQMIRGEEEIQKYETNGHFQVKRLESGEPVSADAKSNSGSAKKFVKRSPQDGDAA